MKVGVNGAVRDISDLKVGANGAVHAVSELWIGVNGAVKKVWPTFPAGSQVILDTVGSGTWTCPAFGRWLLELHGSGGAGGKYNWPGSRSGGGGGGSGEEYEIILNAGETISYNIGGATTSDGQSATFGEYSVDGGGRASYEYGGLASGSLATDGTRGTGASSSGIGGKGNKNKPKQTYGNGGDGANITTDRKYGKDGAIILTYLG